MTAKQFFIKLAKDIKECFENACMCCSTRMAEESRIVPRSVYDTGNQIIDDMKNLPVEPENLMEVIVEDDELPCEGYDDNDNNDDGDDNGYEDVIDITEEMLTEEVIVEPIRSRKNRTPENNSPTQNDFVVIYHQHIQPLEQ